MKVAFTIIPGIEFNQLTMNITVIIPLVVLGYNLENKQINHSQQLKKVK